MKTFQILLLLGVVFFFTMIGCQKEIPAPQIVNNCDTVYIHDTINLAQTDTVIVRDTVIVHDTVTITVPQPSRLQTLTEKTWQIDEVLRNNGGVNTQYIRNGINTTGTNYFNNRIKFNQDGTGSYTDDQGASFGMTWSFTNASQRNLTMNISGFVIYNWEIVELKDNMLHTTTRSSNSLNTARYIQIP